MMGRTAKQFKNGLIDQNPVLVLLLGMCPILGTSTHLSNAVGMGLAVTGVLLCSNLAISLLRKVIPDKIRIAAFVIIIAGFVCKSISTAEKNRLVKKVYCANFTFLLLSNCKSAKAFV